MPDNISDDLHFAEESEEANEQPIVADDSQWKVLIVDDEEQVHSVTHLVLDKMNFSGKPIKMLSANGIAHRARTS